MCGGGSLNPAKRVKKAVKAVKKAGSKINEFNKERYDKTGKELERIRRQTSLGDMYMRSLRPQEIQELPPETVIPGMDEEELKRSRRRNRGSGAATILSEGNQDGLGG